jgi:hypothetical protein
LCEDEVTVLLDVCLVLVELLEGILFEFNLLEVFVLVDVEAWSPDWIPSFLQEDDADNLEIT